MVKTHKSSSKKRTDRLHWPSCLGVQGRGKIWTRIILRSEWDGWEYIQSIYVQMHFFFLQNFSVKRKKDLRVIEWW